MLVASTSRSGRPGATRAVRWAACAFLLLALPAAGEPYRPANPDQVLLRVPAVRLDAAVASLGDALDRAAAQIEYGRLNAEARGFGRAESLLEQWRARGADSARWHVLLADIHQYRHDYSRALELLGRALELDPSNARARLMRASVLQTRGELDAAADDCRVLLAQAESALGLVCLAHVRSLGGDLDRSYALLSRETVTQSDALATWRLTALADMADRRGDPRASESLLRAAMAIDPRDLFVRLTLADLLLTEDRAGEVSRVLDGMPRTQGVLLRLAEAERGGPRAQEALLQLRGAVDEARARGERIDGRDRARLALLLGRDCDALAAAQKNWSVQREPLDVRLLVETAQRCGQSDAIRSVQAWRASNGYEDARVDALLSRASRAF